MKIKIGAAVLVSVICLMFSLVGESYAQPAGEQLERRAPREEQGKQRFEEMQRELNLTPEQRKKIEEDREQGRNAAEDIRKQLRQKKDEIRTELGKNELDVNAIQRIHDEIKELVLAREDHRLKRILTMREILTPEQRELVRGNMKKKFKERNASGMRHGRQQRMDSSQIFEKMKQQLELTDEQAAAIRPVIEEAGNKRKQVRERMRGGMRQEMEKIAAEMEQELSQHLDEYQMDEWKKICAERKAHMRDGMPRRKGGDLLQD